MVGVEPGSSGDRWEEPEIRSTVMGRTSTVVKSGDTSKRVPTETTESRHLVANCISRTFIRLFLAHHSFMVACLEPKSGTDQIPVTLALDRKHSDATSSASRRPSSVSYVATTMSLSWTSLESFGAFQGEQLDRFAAWAAAVASLPVGQRIRM